MGVSSQIRLLNTPSPEPTKLLQYIIKHGLEGCFANLSIVIRILLTLPASVASAERSFSKLKLIKNYLRTTMSQDRLSDLGILSVDSEETYTVQLELVVEAFAKANNNHVNKPLS